VDLLNSFVQSAEHLPNGLHQAFVNFTNMS
jgi:hypothetical protein